MRVVLYIIILSTLFFVPLNRVNIGQLEPVSALAVYVDEANVVMEIDGGEKGIGKSVEEALRDLKENTIGIVYLDTAEYLLIDEAAIKYEDAVLMLMRPNVQTFICDARGCVGECAEYISAHGKLPIISEWKIRKN